MNNKNNVFFFKETDFDTEKFFKITNKNKSILDYGCGKGVWSDQRINKNFYLYDINKKLLILLKKKYTSKNFFFLKKPKFDKDVFLANSVIQYISDEKLDSLKKKIINKFKMIIFSDIPKYPRFFEGFISFFFNPKRLFLASVYYFSSEYRKLGFYYRSLDKVVSILDQHYTFQIIKNLTGEKITRYAIVFKKKKLLKSFL
jgi:hypothetical protein